MKVEKEEEEVVLVERSGLSINHSVCAAATSLELFRNERIHFAKPFALSHILPAQYECERVFGHSFFRVGVQQCQLEKAQSKHTLTTKFWF